MKDRSIAVLGFLVVVSLLICRTGLAQTPDSNRISREYRSDPTLFLEPNRFTIDKDFGTPFIWLEAGFGKTILTTGSVGFGAEALVWSRLRTLSQFRFPVETADYFFGIYSTFRIADQPWRFRLSHISSHDVDGRDSLIIGGSSSHYSREFVEVSTESDAPWRSHVTVGFRYLFHQVTKIESSFSVPIAIRFDLLKATKANRFGFYPFFSSGDAPIGRSIAVGIGGVIRSTSSTANRSFGEAEIQLCYQASPSWAGTDGGVERNGFKLQLNVRDVGD